MPHKVRILGVDNRGSEEIPFGYIYFTTGSLQETRLPFASQHAFAYRTGISYWRDPTREEYTAARAYLLAHKFITELPE